MKRYGLIGYPLGHSFSKDYFTARFRRYNTDAVYNNFPLENIDQLPGLINKYPDLCGLNITIPHKQSVIAYLDRVDSLAEKAGAVNVVSIARSERGLSLEGYNTDIDGFLHSLSLLGDISHYKALVLGTGGASAAVRTALEIKGIEYLTVSRSVNKADLSYNDLDKDITGEYKLIINTTPLGMYPEVKTAPGIPYKILDSDSVLFDLVYNPEKTMFMQLGEERGCTVMNGLEMLYAQAEAAWEIWDNIQC